MALTSEQIKIIEEMHKDGKGISKISKAVNASRTSVYKYLKEHYPQQYKGKKEMEEQQEQTQQSQIQAQTQLNQPSQPQVITPASMTIQKPDAPTLVFVEEQEGEKLARIIAKLNLLQALSEDEIKFLVKVIEQHYSKLDKVLQEEVKQGTEAESRKVFLARLNGIIEDALSLGLEMHYIAKQYKEFCERRGMSFVDAVKVAMELYATNQIQHEETPSETIMKVLDKIVQVNATRQLNAILLASLIKNIYGK
jgi:hypothetical protein